MSGSGGGLERKILVIDDDAGVRDCVATGLRRVGHRVETASNGVDGLRRLADGQFDVVVSDVFMAECDGLEVLRKVRRALPHIRTVLMSGGSPSVPGNYLSVARELGASAVLAKPFQAKDLLQVLNGLGAPAHR